jgi:hypothetical protein
MNNKLDSIYIMYGGEIVVIENDYVKITIKQDKTYTIDSVDNKSYDILMNPFKYTRNDYTKAMEIVIQNEIFEEMRIALIGSLYGHESNCAVLKGRELVVLIDKDIFIININEYKLVKYKKIDCFGDNFAIYLVNNGYIIHGEMEVFKLDYELDKVWEFSGADIFVTQDDKLPFLIDGDRIKIYDWNGTYYEIDLNGKLIYDTYKK